MTEHVEVFKTNVETGEQADRLAHLIQQHFPHYAVNFDLDDCDRILRVKSAGTIQEDPLIVMLRGQGFQAAVLSDEVPPFIHGEIMLSAS